MPEPTVAPKDGDSVGPVGESIPHPVPGTPAGTGRAALFSPTEAISNLIIFNELRCFRTSRTRLGERLARVLYIGHACKQFGERG